MSSRRGPVPVAPWRIATDVGGTFTDLVLADAKGAIFVAKALSVPEQPEVGVLNVLEALAKKVDLSVDGILSRCDHFVHGSTIATNILVQRRGALVGLLVTDGFRDSLEIRRGFRPNPWDHRTPFPPVLVPRYLRKPVRGRIDRNGCEVQPLNEQDIRAAANTFNDEGVESVAICLFNSVLNNSHELAARTILSSVFSKPWITLSSATTPVLGEYERTSTAVINAYVAPRAAKYVKGLSEALATRGLTVPMLIVQNNGGAMTVEHATERPVAMLLSGPAAGVGALSLLGKSIGTDNLISVEIGGTSCEVMLLKSGQPAGTDQFSIGGYDVSLPAIEIHSVGAGGGTIAGIDRNGMLFVGPSGAGARPGPAAYGFGGMEPTVADAQIILGRLRPGVFGEGALTLVPEFAKSAIESSISARLQTPVQSAAAGVVRLVEQHILHAIEEVSGSRGYDPRQFVMVVAGGAGPMHGASIARHLGCQTVYVPRLAGAFCALGMLLTDMKHEFVKVGTTLFTDDNWHELAGSFDELEERAVRQLQREGFSEAGICIEREIDLRYPGEVGSIRMNVASMNGTDPAALRDAYHGMHKALNGYSQPQAQVEITAIRIIGKGRFASFQLAGTSPANVAPAPYEWREVYFSCVNGGFHTPVYRGADLTPGHRLKGPLVIEESTTTVVVGPRDTVTIDSLGSFVIQLD